MSAEDVENDLRGVLSQFSNSEKRLAEVAMQKKPLYAITIDTYENLPFPIMRHTFYGRTIKEAEAYVEAHKKTDEFFRGCYKGNWKDVKCRHTTPVVRKIGLSQLQAGGSKKPGGLRKSIIGKIQQKGR